MPAAPFRGKNWHRGAKIKGLFSWSRSPQPQRWEFDYFRSRPRWAYRVHEVSKVKDYILCRCARLPRASCADNVLDDLLSTGSQAGPSRVELQPALKVLPEYDRDVGG